ncbi:MAG: aspartate/glutamate racemase family protein [Alphaproteobacteria bacterium]|nr:aspartate/glutamate racemase family protein [Alphaproteobacteria bacterium]
MADAADAHPETKKGGFVNRTAIPFRTDGGVAGRARIGVIVLASDHTIEHEFRQIIDMPGVAFYAARIRNDPSITPETLADMESRIAPTTDLILPGVELDVVAYGCTSASMVLGEQTVFDRIHEARPGVACTTPITAAFAAFDAFGASNIAVLTPYRDDVNQKVRNYIEARGYRVPVFGSFNEENDNVAARIDLASIRSAAIELGRMSGVDAVFVSCTSIRLATVAREVEEELGKPVTSSNHAMAWHCLRLAGIEDQQPQFGRLFTLPLA